MASLKSFIEYLAPVVNMTEAALYERQRILVRARVLKPERAGRGPGNGLIATPHSVALLLIAALSTPDLADAPHRTRELLRARSTETQIGFGEALADLLANPAGVAGIQEVLISQTSCWAQLRKLLVETFKSSDQAEPGVRIVAHIGGGELRAIAEHLAEIAA